MRKTNSNVAMFRQSAPCTIPLRGSTFSLKAFAACELTNMGSVNNIINKPQTCHYGPNDCYTPVANKPNQERKIQVVPSTQNSQKKTVIETTHTTVFVRLRGHHSNNISNALTRTPPVQESRVTRRLLQLNFSFQQKRSTLPRVTFLNIEHNFHPQARCTQHHHLFIFLTVHNEDESNAQRKTIKVDFLPC